MKSRGILVCLVLVAVFAILGLVTLGSNMTTADAHGLNPARAAAQKRLKDFVANPKASIVYFLTPPWKRHPEAFAGPVGNTVAAFSDTDRIAVANGNLH